MVSVRCLLAYYPVSKTAFRRGDVKAVGFITRNFNSAGLFRIDELLAELDIE